MKHRGFTLVEVLVVLVILGLTATFATLGFQRLESDRLQKQAGWISAWLQSVSDDAILNGVVYGAWLDSAGNRLEIAYFHDNRWWPVSGDGARSEAIDEGFTLYIDSADGWRRILSYRKDRENGRPAILFMPTGVSMPERLRIETDDQRAALIERDEDGLYAWSLFQ